MVYKCQLDRSVGVMALASAKINRGPTTAQTARSRSSTHNCDPHIFAQFQESPLLNNQCFKSPSRVHKHHSVEEEHANTHLCPLLF